MTAHRQFVGENMKFLTPLETVWEMKKRPRIKPMTLL